MAVLKKKRQRICLKINTAIEYLIESGAFVKNRRMAHFAFLAFKTLLSGYAGITYLCIALSLFTLNIAV